MKRLRDSLKYLGFKCKYCGFYIDTNTTSTINCPRCGKEIRREEDDYEKPEDTDN